MTRSRRLGSGGWAAAAGAVVLLATASTLAVGAAAGAFDERSSLAGSTSGTCSVPALPGATVAVDLQDMRSMMNRGGMLGQDRWRSFRAGMMRLVASPTVVAAGVVSLAVSNTGYLSHELVVLPLGAGQQAGNRTLGSDGTVDEDGSLGEASASCAAGAGDGIAAGSSGWLTLRLAAGRYELLCNLPGHYAAGMHAELDVS